MPGHSDTIPIDPVQIVRELSALPHRGATTDREREAADILAGHLARVGAAVERQRFHTPKTYLTEVWWLVGSLVVGLLVLDALPWPGALLVTIAAGLGLHYFDWRRSPISWLPPQAQSENVLGSMPAETPGPTRLILMAHYDSAPVSRLYVPSMVTGFRKSLLISLGLMGAAVVVALLYAAGVGRPILIWLRWLLAVYFLGQGLMSSVDFLRLGYTNGAADNATGAGIAVATAAQLWRSPIPGWQVEVVLTGAEEVNLKGSLAYLRTCGKDLDPLQAFVLNFDNVGAGELRIITETGSFTDVAYDNPLVQAALATARQDQRFQSVKPGVWHTGDFDSLWFARAGIPSLTLSAQDDAGRVPHLHRPSDTMEHVDPSLVRLAVEFAEATIRHLAHRHSAAP